MVVTVFIVVALWSLWWHCGHCGDTVFIAVALQQHCGHCGDTVGTVVVTLVVTLVVLLAVALWWHGGHCGGHCVHWGGFGPSGGHCWINQDVSVAAFRAPGTLEPRGSYIDHFFPHRPRLSRRPVQKGLKKRWKMSLKGARSQCLCVYLSAVTMMNVCHCVCWPQCHRDRVSRTLPRPSPRCQAATVTEAATAVTMLWASCVCGGLWPLSACT